MELTQIRLRKNEDRRLRGGHLWVYSNEVDTSATPLSMFSAGQCVSIVNQQGRTIGNGYVNPNSLICARLMSPQGVHPFEQDFLRERIRQALTLREHCYTHPCYRLVFGESDGLPGLVVDRYGDVLVVQLNTAGMDAAREPVLEALRAELSPGCILLRNDSPIRLSEGLPQGVETAFGELPASVDIIENSARFRVAMSGGQKTGWYFDHRENRQRLSRWVRDARVLDVFSYQGGWGIQTALAGASSVTCVDASEQALACVMENAALNGVADRVTTEAGDAFKVLKQLAQAGERFDVVILDPPAFVKRRKDMATGLEAYQRLNGLALSLVGSGGLLVSASCSSHVDAASFLNAIRQAGVKSHRRLQVVEQGHQGPDHPVHPAISETDYLKCYWLRVL
jgi:23S rRNA (cytosine1962-C5)-methyltransferase